MLFYEECKNQIYKSPLSDITRFNNDLYLPVEIDTEFQDNHFPFRDEGNKKLTISVQMRPILGAPHFFLHPEMSPCKEKYPQFRIIEKEFCVLDLIQLYGYDVIPVNNIGNILENGYKICNLYIHLYGFHLVSDLMRLFQGRWLTIIESRITNLDHPDGNITHGKRLLCYNKKNIKNGSSLDTGQLVMISNKCFKIYLKIFDNCALQGNISYATLCSNNNVTLEHKDALTINQKKYMLNTFRKSPNLVAKYAMGDVMNYEAFQGHTRHLNQLYKLLDLDIYFVSAKSTIGMCVFEILQSAMMKEFELEKTEQLKWLVQEASHGSLMENRSSTQMYLAKTNGGRCYNNRPTEPSISGIIVDVDIKGCYAKGLEIQDYPIGRPIIIEYNKKSNINHYDTLKEFLKNYEKELIDGLWFCRITTKTPLSFEQDYFMSWYPPKKVSDILKTDYEKEIEEVQINENDQTRIYSNEIHLGVLQSDGLEWIKNYLSRSERDELLEKTQVVAAAFYPKSLECKTLKEFKYEYGLRKGSNYCKAYLKNKKRVVVKKHTMENHFWYKANIGKMIVTKLSDLRKQYSKTKSDEASMNEFIKLIINTTYGDLVSPHFYIANTIVGNNITARARAMAWYMEKSLHGIQTITDGCAFELNRVVKSRYTLTNSKYFSLKNEGPKKDLGYGYLMEKKRRPEEVELLERDIETMNNKVAKHIKEIFGKSKVVYQFEIEVRDIYTGIATHGPSNYQMYKTDKIMKTKMRSYKNQEYINYNINEMKSEGEYSRTVKWLDSIYREPRKITRGEPFVEEKIIKTNQYIKQKQRLDKRGIAVGEIDHQVRIINEFNIAMYLFKTHKQFEAWKKEHDELKACFKQSYEATFENEKGQLNYKKMLEEIQDKIKKGEKNFYKRKKMTKEHPKKEKMEQMEKYIEEKIAR